MRDVHLSRELLEAVDRGRVSPRKVIEIGLDHLRALCPACADEWAAWERQKAEERSERPLPRLPAAFILALGQLLPGLEQQEKEAARDLRDLLPLSQAERLRRVEKGRTRFGSPALARQLLAEARRLARLDAAASRQWAEVACKVASRVPEAAGSAELLALGLAELGNAERLLDDSNSAAALLAASRNVVRIGGVVDPVALARIDKLEGSLCLDQRRFQEAEALLSRARLFYGLSAGTETEVVRVEMTLVLASLEAGSPQRAKRTAQAALEREAARSHAQLYFSLRINLARAHFECGELSEAESILDEDEPHGDLLESPLWQLRYPWIRGRIAAARREHDVAEALFVEVRDAFVEAGMGFDAALVSLDLAEVYLRSGRNRETRRLAEEMLPIFAAQDIHPEALAALKVFTEAARGEALSFALVRDLRGYLAEARSDRALPFTRPQ